MRIIAKVIESMLSKDATQTWTGQTSAVASSDTWHWGGFSEETATICSFSRILFDPRVGWVE